MLHMWGSRVKGLCCLFICRVLKNPPGAEDRVAAGLLQLQEPQCLLARCYIRSVSQRERERERISADEDKKDRVRK